MRLLHNVLRDFVHYLVTSDDSLVRGLTNFYFYSIMAPESFFHTALLNSRYRILLFIKSFFSLIEDYDSLPSVYKIN